MNVSNILQIPFIRNKGITNILNSKLCYGTPVDYIVASPQFFLFKDRKK
jgi:hypothetical protein